MLENSAEVSAAGEPLGHDKFGDKPLLYEFSDGGRRGIGRIPGRAEPWGETET
jgi:hypothetical protein